MPERKTYNKLVRNHIPQIIQDDGRACGIEIMSDADYLKSLREKLLEEAQEASGAQGDELIKELADLYEVIDALMLATGINEQLVINKQRVRSEQRGGFKKKIRLLWTE